MELVVEKEIIAEYFNLLCPKNKSEKEINLIISLESSENSIKISDEYLKIIEEYLTQNHSFNIDFFQTFITALNDNNRIISFVSSKRSNEKVLIEEMISYNKSDYTFVLSKNNSKKINKDITCVYDNIKSPNKDWLLQSLITTRVFQINSTYFSNLNELQNIFINLSNLPKEDKELHIIDSYFTLNSTSIVKLFKNKGFRFKCYTSSYMKSNNKKDIIRNNLKNEFGKKTSVKFSSNKRILHERKIINGLLVIDSTHDFSEIILSNNNWEIYISINKENSIKDNAKLIKYK